jgi:hypothetical protein
MEVMTEMSQKTLATVVVAVVVALETNVAARVSIRLQESSISQ